MWIAPLFFSSTNGFRSQPGEQFQIFTGPLSGNFDATGHGAPLAGDNLVRSLSELAIHFDNLALPRHGRYISSPAITDLTGIVSLPPKPTDPFPKVAAACAIVAVAGIALAASSRRS